MINELDRVVLTVDLPDQHLRTGDIGVVVLTHPERAAYTVEFVTLAGETVAVIPVFAHQVRLFRAGEMAVARALEQA